MAKEKEELTKEKEELVREKEELARDKERVAREKEQWESEIEEHAQAERRRREVAEEEATEREEKVAQELAEAKAEAQLARAQAEQAREEARHLQRQQDRTASIEDAPAVADDYLQRSIKETMEKLRMSTCSGGYAFEKTEEGYRCTGGSHFVSFEQLGMKKASSAVLTVAAAPAVADDRIQDAIKETMAKLGMQPCPDGYAFRRTEDGYRCMGGSHHISFQQLGMK
jgi:hypothetical protein